MLAILGPAFSSQVEVVFPVANRGETPIISPLSTKIGITEKKDHGRLGILSGPNMFISAL